MSTTVSLHESCDLTPLTKPARPRYCANDGAVYAYFWEAAFNAFWGCFKSTLGWGLVGAGAGFLLLGLQGAGAGALTGAIYGITQCW